MDSLALLCNLHGDGPATLAGLRELGCYELFEVLQVDSEVLGTLFSGNLRIAVRFGREARILAERLGESPGRETPHEDPQLEKESFAQAHEEYGTSPDIEEFTPILEASSAQVLTPFPALSSCGPESAALLGIEPVPAPELPKEAAHQDSIGANGPVVDAVRGVWARLDNREQPKVAQAASSLEDAGLDGLSPEFAAKLKDAGVASLGELLATDVLALSTATKIPYTRLAHLQFLGRQELGPERPDELLPFGGSPVDKSEATGQERDSLQETDFPEPYRQPIAEDGPAGPFA